VGVDREAAPPAEEDPGSLIRDIGALRPLPGAPVATPLAWDEVDGRLDPLAFTPSVVLERVERLGDLFAAALAPVSASASRGSPAVADGER
jgi:DNA primase